VSDGEVQPLLAAAEARVLADDLDHPEAVCWDPGAGAILAGGEAGQLYEIDLAGGGVRTRAELGGSLLGIALDGSGRAYVCNATAGRVQRVEPDGRHVDLGPPMSYPNYLAFDAEGSLWVTDSGGWGEKSGRVFRIDAAGAGEEAGFGRFRFANGIAIADDVAYMVESETGSLWRLDLRSERAEIVLELPRTVPDGVAIDAEGGVWVSCFQPNRVYRLDPSGELAVVLDDWSGEEMLSPTNVAFAGADLRTLVLASLCGRTVKQIEVWVAGRPLEYPGEGQ
jgi:gluconolactonase